VAAIPHGDRSAAAAERTARIAALLLDDADRNGEHTYVTKVLTATSPLWAEIDDGAVYRAKLKAHIVSDPINKILVKALTASGATIDVRVSYHAPALKAVTSTGAVIEDDPPFDATETYVMVFERDQWRLSTTKANK
jgi:hypothetical protein